MAVVSSAYSAGYAAGQAYASRAHPVEKLEVAESVEQPEVMQSYEDVKKPVVLKRRDVRELFVARSNMGGARYVDVDKAAGKMIREAEATSCASSCIAISVTVPIFAAAEMVSLVGRAFSPVIGPVAYLTFYVFSNMVDHFTSV